MNPGTPEKSARVRRIILLTAIFTLLHLAIGLMAFMSGGYFMYGATAPERFLIHSLNGYEWRYSVTGNHLEVVNDLCIQTCDECRMECYALERIMLSCVMDECILSTRSGKPLLSEGDSIALLIKQGLLFADVKFVCGDDLKTTCGFENKMQGNMSFISDIPKGVHLDLR
ncbi:MAG: hypothetical protein ABIH11_01000 [Candidatus Altiarchaeota archaeon]